MLRFSRRVHRAAQVACAAMPLPAAIPLDQVAEQSRTLQAALGAMSLERTQIVLVLGAGGEEAHRFKGEDVRHVLLSDRAPSTQDPFAIQCDFNELTHLLALKGALRGRLSAIIPDRNVMKFTAWGIPHFRHFAEMLAPGGTFYLPVETWGSIQLGIAPENAADPADFPELQGERELDAGVLADLIRLGMARAQAREGERSRWPPVVPSALVVPKAWVRFDDATRARALELWTLRDHVPAILDALIGKGGFRSVQRVDFTPTFLQEPGLPPGRTAYLAFKR
jgi:hypothetical protein